MNSPSATARSLIDAAAVSATVTRHDGDVDVRFDARSLDRLDRFANSSADRFNLVDAELESTPVRFILRSSEPENDLDDTALCDAAVAAYRMRERHQRPRARLYRQGPHGLETLEA